MDVSILQFVVKKKYVTMIIYSSASVQYILCYRQLINASVLENKSNFEKFR